MEHPTLSILIPTSAKREAFWPWTGYQIKAQLGVDPSRLRVLVATEASPALVREKLNLHPKMHLEVLYADPTMSLGDKRQLLLQRAQSALIAWHDDDDWHSPCRLQRALELLRYPARCVVFHGLAYYDLKSGLGVTLDTHKNKPIPISFVGETIFARRAIFESRNHGEDTRWLRALMERKTWEQEAVRVSAVGGHYWAALVHAGNTSQVGRRFKFTESINHRLFDFHQAAGELEALRARLELA